MSFIATGLGIAGLMGVEGAMGAAATVAMGEALGAGVGALTNPKDRLKGALIGGATGAAGGALGAGIGALGGAAAGEAGATASEVAANSTGQVGGQTVGQVGGQTVGQVGGQAAGQVGGQTVGDEVTGTAMNQVTNATEAAPKAMPTLASAPKPVGAPVPGGTPEGGSIFSGNIGSALQKVGGPQLLNLAGAVMNPTPTYDSSGQQTIDEQKQLGLMEANQAYHRGWAPPAGKAHGGSIRLENNAFIIPADVVSAIGNGSTKAGAKYLDHLFTALSAGPPPKAGSLAKRRTQERHKA